jgi:outer membrane protein W
MFRTAALALAVVAVVALAAPAAAQQSLSLNIGYFAVRGQGSRVAGDTIVENLVVPSPYPLSYWVSDFNNVTFGAEWLIPAGEFLEVGAGVNYYAQTVPSSYRDLVHPDGSDITQSLRLRTVPISVTGRWIMTGRRAKVQPYIGAGVGIVVWRYSESGDFADADLNIFNWDYTDSGTAVGPVIFGGIRGSLNKRVALGGELRYQYVNAPLNPSVDFQGTRLDLSGLTYQASVIFRF